MKKCTKCGKVKDESEFYRDYRNKNSVRYLPICKNCKDTNNLKHKKNNIERFRELDNLRQKKYRQDPEKSNRINHSDRKKFLKAKYNMTIECYDKMFEDQNGMCALCGKPETAIGNNGKLRRLAVDHCHKTGKVRKLLCGVCNTQLGIYENRKEEFETYINKCSKEF